MIVSGHDVASPSRTDLASADLGIVFMGAGQWLGWQSLSRGSILVALVRVAQWCPWLGAAGQMLSTAEADRVKRRRIASDRESLTLAYALQRLLLGKVLRIAPMDVPLYRDALGCPRLHGDLAYTSLSHAEGLIALAVTTSGPVGIDIEPSARAAVMPGIARSVCHPGEAAGLSRFDEDMRAAEMLAIWVRKEALLKAAGIGLAVPMESFAAPEHAALVLPALQARPVQVRMLAAGSQCVAAVAGVTGAAVNSGWLQPPMGRCDATGAVRASARTERHDAAVVEGP